MKCPHCLKAFHGKFTTHWFGADKDYSWLLKHVVCPSCLRYIIFLDGRQIENTNVTVYERLVHPKGISRAPLSTAVPEEFASDYKEACLVMADSAKASAALSRRCLQNLIREKEGIKKPTLSQEIDEVIETKRLPSHLSGTIDALRNLGNFAAHPIKDKNTGEIVEVEPGEAEWTLDVLEGLFDFYFVQPAELQRKRDALNKKLKDAGKPPMK